MDEAVHCCSTQVIDEDGVLNIGGLESFVKEVKLGPRGSSYAVVSIMGPQSSGKSTLLNHLFRTNFWEMDASEGRSQTTKGIWLAKADGIEPLTLVMDLEGNDGIERPEEDTAFEKQTALFALTVSDVVLINTWCHDLGRDSAASRPLLRTIFQVMTRIFSPHKTTLMFVIRDKTKTPLKNLEEMLRKDVQKIWDSVSKSFEHRQTPLYDFFNVEVVALSNYEDKEDQFKEEVASLKERFFDSISPRGLAGDRSSVVPGSAFCFSAQQIWRVIKDSKDLDLPAHRIMVANYRCEEIAVETYSAFVTKEEWCQTVEALQSGALLPDMGMKFSVFIHNCLERYESEAIYFDEGVKSTKAKQLEENLLQLMEPAFQLFTNNLRAATFEKFRNTFDEALSRGEGFSLAASSCSKNYMSQFHKECRDAVIERANSKWDASKHMEKLQRDIDALIAVAREARFFILTVDYKASLRKALIKPTGDLLDQANEETWPGIRKLLQNETESAISGISNELVELEVDKQKEIDTTNDLRAYATDLVEMVARDKAAAVLADMTNRFLVLFEHDCQFNKRVWTGEEDFKAISTEAYTACLELLSVRAAVRLDDKMDFIYSRLKHVLIDAEKKSTTDTTYADLLVTRNWAEDLSLRTLIMPVECRGLWENFQAETKHNFTKGKNAWKAAKRKRKQKEIAMGIGSIALTIAIEAAGAVIGADLSALSPGS